MSPVSSASRMNWTGRYQSQLGMLPADEGFEPYDLPVDGRILGW